MVDGDQPFNRIVDLVLVRSLDLTLSRLEVVGQSRGPLYVSLVISEFARVVGLTDIELMLAVGKLCFAVVMTTFGVDHGLSQKYLY